MSIIKVLQSLTWINECQIVAILIPKYSKFAQDFVTVPRSAKFKSCVLFTKQIISWHFVTNVTETDYLIWHSKWRRMWTYLKFWLGAILQFWAKYQLPSACQYLINTWKGPKGLNIFVQFFGHCQVVSRKIYDPKGKMSPLNGQKFVKILHWGCPQCGNWRIFQPLRIL